MRKTLLVTLTLLVAGIAAGAGDPWKQKDYKDWDVQDLERIFYDSPWGIKVNIAGANAAEITSMGSSSGHVGGSMQPGVNVDAKLVFVVQWGSSLTMRRAYVVASTREGRISEADGEKLLEAPAENYVISLAGPGLVELPNLEMALMKVTYLKPKKTKEQVQPSKIVLKRGTDGKLNTILFTFPKKLENGDPTIGAQEKSVEFVCKAPGAFIQTTFNLEKMVAEKGPDW